jgi:KaiC/GvpD/RAD55 family RecA-like ATPase
MNLIHDDKTMYSEDRRRRIDFAIKVAARCLKNGDLLTAENFLAGFHQRQIGSDTVQLDLESTIVNSTQLINEDIPVPREILSPWLIEGSINMIYGLRGAGKTWLSLIIAMSVSRKKTDGIQIGPWEVSTATGVLYVDGEMGEYELQKRLKLLKESLGKDHPDYPLDILSGSRYAKNTSKQLNISDEMHRRAIYRYFEENHEQYQLLILDNIASLTPGIDENSKLAWDPINQWFISLRHLGISVIFVHHSGKGKQQRGTSGREDVLDSIIQLSPPPDKESAVGAKFSIEFEKARNLPPDSNIDPFTFELITDEKDGLTWASSATMAMGKEKHEIAIALIIEGSLKQKEIAEILGVTPPMISILKKKAVKNGLVKENGEPTEEGEEFAKSVNARFDLNQYKKN